MFPSCGCIVSCQSIFRFALSLYPFSTRSALVGSTRPRNTRVPLIVILHFLVDAGTNQFPHGHVFRQTIEREGVRLLTGSGFVVDGQRGGHNLLASHIPFPMPAVNVSTVRFRRRH